MTTPITSAARRTIEAFSVTYAAILDRTTAAQTKLPGVRTANITPDTGQVDNTGDDRVMSSWNFFNKGNLTVEGGFLSLDLYAKLTSSVVTVGGSSTAATVLFTPAATGGTGSGGPFDYSGSGALTFTVDGNSVALSADETNLAGVVAAVDAALPGTYTVTASGTQVKIALTAAGTGSISIGGTGMAQITGSSAYSNTAGANASELSVPFWDEDCGNQPPYPAIVRMPSRDSLGNSLYLDVLLYKVQLGPVQLQNIQYKTVVSVNYTGQILMSDYDELGNVLPKAACGRLISVTRS